MMAVPAANPGPRYSLAEYAQLPEDELYTIELAQGLLVHEPAPGAEHGRIATRIARLIDEHAQAGDLGVVLSNAGFVLFEDPPTVRAPDVSFIARDRVQERPLDAGFWHGAPDLAVEINSPSNTASDALRKVNEYLDAGVRLVWIVDPPTRTVTVYRSRDEIRLLGQAAELDGGEVLPGFRTTVDALIG